MSMPALPSEGTAVLCPYARCGQGHPRSSLFLLSQHLCSPQLWPRHRIPSRHQLLWHRRRLNACHLLVTLLDPLCVQDLVLCLNAFNTCQVVCPAIDAVRGQCAVLPLRELTPPPPPPPP